MSTLGDLRALGDLLGVHIDFEQHPGEVIVSATYRVPMATPYQPAGGGHTAVYTFHGTPERRWYIQAHARDVSIALDILARRVRAAEIV